MSTDAGYLFLVTKALVKMWWYNKRVNGAIFATQSSFGEVGEYSGLLGEYCGLVAEYDGPEPGLRGEVLLLYTGLVGEYDGLVGDVGLVGLKLGEVGE